MSQKINPTSLRIGQQFSWNITFQNYGKSLMQLMHYHSNFFFFLFLTQKLKNQNLLLANPKFCVFPSKFRITKIAVRLNSANKYENDIKFLLSLPSLLYWLPKNSVLIIFLSSSFCSAQILASYFTFLLEKNIIFRRAVTILVNFLETQIKKQKIVYLKFGLKKIKLKGFKIKLSGRFENTKNQMTKKLEYNIGSLSLLSISSYVEFCSLNIYSKLGVCNFKIWLFYS
uniref:Ribosomal protein S3 n=1 Tax=Ceramothamnion japonicum TaxID=218448 RepID=A0A0E3DBJ0_CERJP|nr:ribosomal protein S3 [Ceramium japonicum]